MCWRPIPKDDTTELKIKIETDDVTIKLFQTKLNDSKTKWTDYLRSHSDTIDASAHKKREHKHWIRMRGYQAATFLLSKQPDNSDNAERCRFVVDSECVDGNAQKLLSDYQRAQLLKHANYPLPISLIVIDTMSKKHWAQHLSKCISILSFNPEANIGIVLMQWGQDSLATMDCVGLVA